MNFEIDNFSGFMKKVAAESNDILLAIYKTLLLIRSTDVTYL